MTVPLEVYLSLPDSNGGTHVRVQYEKPSPGSVYVLGVFRTRDDSEIDFKGLPLDLQEFILEKCLSK